MRDSGAYGRYGEPPEAWRTAESRWKAEHGWQGGDRFEESSESLELDHADDSSAVPQFEAQAPQAASRLFARLLAAHSAQRREVTALKKRIALLESHNAGNSLPHPGSWLLNVVSKLESIQHESAYDDWDGDGSMAVSKQTLAYALHLARLLSLTNPEPDINADPDGHLSFEWYFAPRQVLTASVSPEGKVYFAGLFGTNRNHGVEELGELLPHALASNLERLFRTEA